jgi:hypothetical protein
MVSVVGIGIVVSVTSVPLTVPGVSSFKNVNPGAPRAVLAVAALLDPVPPLEIGSGVVADRVVNAPAAGVVAPMAVPSIVPPVIATAFAFCVAIAPSPA